MKYLRLYTHIHTFHWSIISSDWKTATDVSVHISHCRSVTLVSFQSISVHSSPFIFLLGHFSPFHSLLVQFNSFQAIASCMKSSKFVSFTWCFMTCIDVLHIHFDLIRNLARLLWMRHSFLSCKWAKVNSQEIAKADSHQVQCISGVNLAWRGQFFKAANQNHTNQIYFATLVTKILWTCRTFTPAQIHCLNYWKEIFP